MEFIKSFLPYFLAVVISLSLVVFLHQYLGWVKTILLIIAITLVDVDHFLFGSKGFLEIPDKSYKILHAFNYGIEFTLVVIIFNLLTGIQTLKLGIKSWLFPEIKDYQSKVHYYIAWTARIILLGMLIHYALDLPIYILKNKWDYYDYSIVHYYLTK